MSSGVDSIGIAELTHALNEKFSSDMPATLLFDNPSINSIVPLLATKEPIAKSDGNQTS